MTYDVFGGTLNLALSIYLLPEGWHDFCEAVLSLALSVDCISVEKTQ